MFSREMYENPSQELIQVAPKERMRAIAHLWKALPQEQRDVYNGRAEALREQSNARFGIEPGRRRAARIAKSASATASPVKHSSSSSSTGASASLTSPTKQENASKTTALTPSKAHASKTKTKASQKAATSSSASANAISVAGGGGPTKTKAAAKLEVDHVFGREGDDSDSSVEDGDSSGDDDEPNANLQKASVLNHQHASAAGVRSSFAVPSSTASASLSTRPTPPSIQPSAHVSIKDDSSSDDEDDDDAAPLTIAESPFAPPSKSVPAAASSSSAASASRSNAHPSLAQAAAEAASSSSEASGSESGSDSESEQEEALFGQMPGAGIAYTQFVAQTLGKQTAQQQQAQKAAVVPASGATSAKLPLSEWSAPKQPTGRAVSMTSSDLQMARKHKPHALPTMVASAPIFGVPAKKSKRQEQPVA